MLAPWVETLGKDLAMPYLTVTVGCAFIVLCVLSVFVPVFNDLVYADFYQFVGF